jgi:hypothetical protein
LDLTLVQLSFPEALQFALQSGKRISEVISRAIWNEQKARVFIIIIWGKRRLGQTHLRRQLRNESTPTLLTSRVTATDLTPLRLATVYTCLPGRRFSDDCLEGQGFFRGKIRVKFIVQVEELSSR